MMDDDAKWKEAQEDALQMGWERSMSLNPTADAGALLSRHLAGIEARLVAREHASLLGLARPDRELLRMEKELTEAMERAIGLAERGDFRCYQVASELCARLYRLGLVG